jgi:hypothetical protein
MTETGTTGAIDNGQPQPPIIILGRDEAFLAFALSLADAVEQLREGGTDPAPPPTRLDFFDVLGRRLEPVIIGGELVGLIVQDFQEEIRYRIRRLYHDLIVGVPLDEIPPDRQLFPEGSTFEESIQELVGRQHQHSAHTCTWLDRFLHLHGC